MVCEGCLIQTHLKSVHFGYSGKKVFGGDLDEMYKLRGKFVQFIWVRVVRDLLGFVGR